MNNYKIKVNNEAESKEAQKLFEQLGFTWAGDYPENGDWYSHLYAENSTCCYLSPYVWNGLGDKFQELTLPQLRDLVAQSKNEQGLISGAEALKAMMEGKRVLYSGYGNQDWDTALNCNLGVFLRHEKFPDFSFKIVPRTIKLELEIPAPFEPKVGEEYFYIQSCRNGYARSRFNSEHCDQHLVALGAWRTEEEIKQVVAALRGIKG